MSSLEETSHTSLPQSTDPGNSTPNDDLSILMSKVRNPQTQEYVNSPTDSLTVYPTVSPTLSDANINCETYENNESPESSNNETEHHPEQHSSQVDQIKEEPVRYELPPRTNREAVKEAIWLKGLLEELGVELNRVTVNCDNQGAIHLSRNHVFHERTKHINVRYHFIKEVLEAKTVEVLKVGTEHNAADALTKV
nr:retrovirus-related Pol polyprotein from transposon TNT 1-94 [Tanacetum cinerariifolium]